MKGVVAFAFGVPETIQSNRRIAEIASDKARELGAVGVYTQDDVRVGPGVIRFLTDEEPGSPPPTLRMARGAVQWAMHPDHRIVEIWVAAAKPHLWRCLRDMKAAVQEAGGGIVVRVCEEIEQVPEREWFCADSTQGRTQSREAWEKRERIVCLMPFCVYKRVAS